MRNFNLIAGLVQRGHVLDLVAFQTEDQAGGPSATAVMREYCRQVVTVPQPTRSLAKRARDTLLQPLPDMALRLQSPLMQRSLAVLLRENSYDVIQIEGIEMAPFALALPQTAPACLVFDDHNAEYVLQQRAFGNDVRHPRLWLGAGYSLIQWQKLRRYERCICNKADRVVAVSEADRQALQRLMPGLRVAVVPNGVDLQRYCPGTVAPLPGLQQPALVFTGKMDYRPNVDAALWFATDVFPLVLQQLPSAHFYIVGQQPHERLASLASRPGISLTGRVPDIRPYNAAAAVYVVPLRIGGGTRLKVLEAMAMGLPIVSTRLGCDGFPVEDGKQLRLADDPVAFAASVVELWKDRTLAARLGTAARSFVAAHYGWDSIVPMMEQVYRA